ncbi:Vesicle transport protein GOT1 [Bienertia sinuspersici]
MGNILFLSGLALTIGLKSTVQFFMKPQNYKVYISITFPIPFAFHVVSGLADNRHAVGILWIPCTLQWVLAYIGSFCPEDPYSWMDIPTTLYQIGMSMFFLLSLLND